jgi:hypothetical protein
MNNWLKHWIMIIHFENDENDENEVRTRLDFVDIVRINEYLLFYGKKLKKTHQASCFTF